MATSPKSPWRRDTNERYREVIRLIMGLSTASLLLPVFFARDFLAIARGTPLIAVFSWEIYVSWLALGVAVCVAILFHYFSAKWIRLAWGKPAGIMFWKNLSDRRVEALLNLTFWTSVAGFNQSEFATIRLPVSFRRRARGEKIIISASGNPAPSPDPQLIKAVAKGHGWFSEIKHGGVASLRDLAERQGMDRGDTGRILRLAFLAPDIVEAILQGRQPRDLTFKRLMRLSILSVSWAEQRESFGFPL